MRFECSDEVGHAPDLVFHLLRDDMDSLLPYLEDVESIEVVERREEEGGVRITNLWRGSTRKAPSVVQKVLTPDLVSWTDYAFWVTAARRAEWRLEPRVGGRLFECKGTTTIGPGARDDACRIQIQGELNVYPERLPGVPRIMAGALRGKVEQFICDMIVPNMKTMSRGVQRCFDDRRRAGGDAAGGAQAGASAGP